MGRRHVFGDHRRLPSIRVGPFWPMHPSLFSPTGDPSKPGTGTTHLFYGGACAHQESMSGRPDQPSTRRNRRFTLISCDLPCSCVFAPYTCPAWRSGVRLCRRATGLGIARPTAYREVPRFRRPNHSRFTSLPASSRSVLPAAAGDSLHCWMNRPPCFRSRSWSNSGAARSRRVPLHSNCVPPRRPAARSASWLCQSPLAISTIRGHASTVVVVSVPRRW